MTHTTFAILSILSANVFLYILFIATPYFSTADTYMGVFLDHAYRKSPEAKKIFKHIRFLKKHFYLDIISFQL